MEKLINGFTGYLDANLENYISFGIKVLLTIIVFLVGQKIISWVLKMTRRSLGKMNVDQGVQQFVTSLLKCILYVLLIAILANQFGVETTSVAALLGSIGVAIGFALQGSLSNFAGGILILMLKPFVVGDYILEDSNKNEGVVVEIQIFYTKLQSVDNKIAVIPNGILANSSLTNITGEKFRRLDISVGISYEADLMKAKAILLDMLSKHEEILKDRDYVVVVEDLGESAVVLGCKGWVKTESYWATKWQMLEDIKLTFDREGIEIPYNKLQVHLLDKTIEK